VHGLLAGKSGTWAYGCISSRTCSIFLFGRGDIFGRIDQASAARPSPQERLTQAWDPNGPNVSSSTKTSSLEPIEASLRNLAPDSKPRQLLQDRALQICGEITEGYWLQSETLGGGLPQPFLLILIFWLAVLFGTFGLLVPVNMTVIVTLVTCALSVGAAIYLIVDMDHPYIGFIHVSDAPLRAALARLGRP
jgi:hypothetical protein